MEEELATVLGVRQFGGRGAVHGRVGALFGSLLQRGEDRRAQSVAHLHECIHVAGHVGADAAGVHGVAGDR